MTCLGFLAVKVMGLVWLLASWDECFGHLLGNTGTVARAWNGRRVFEERAPAERESRGWRLRT